MYLDTSDLRNIRNDPRLQALLKAFLERNDARISLSEIHLAEWLIAGEVQAEDDFQWWRANFPNCSLEPSRRRRLEFALRILAQHQPKPPWRFPDIESVESVAAWKELVDYDDTTILESGMQVVFDGLRKQSPNGKLSLDQHAPPPPMSPALQALAEEFRTEGITDASQIDGEHLRRAIRAHTSLKVDGLQMDAMISAFETVRSAPPVDLAPLSEFFDFPIGDPDRVSAFMLGLVDDFDQLQLLSVAPLFFMNHYFSTRELPKEFFSRNPEWRSLPVAIAQATRAARIADSRQGLSWGDVYDERHIEFGLSATWFTVDGRTYKHLKTALKRALPDLYTVEILRTGSGLEELLSR